MHDPRGAESSNRLVIAVLLVIIVIGGIGLALIILLKVGKL